MAGKGRQAADESLALALAGGMGIEAAAEHVGLAARTVHRRLECPEFRRRVSELRGQMVSQALGAMSASMTAAATKLRELLDASDQRVALGAARALLELGVKLRDSAEIEERLRVLEEQVAGAGDAQP